MPTILFVCTGNLYRSPLAAAFFLRELQRQGKSNGWMVESAGTWAIPGQHIPPNLLKAAWGQGIDLNQHVTRQVDRDMLARFDLIVVMEKGHREALRIEFPFLEGKLHLLSELADGLEYNVPDPANSTAEMNNILAEIFRLVDRAYPGICRLAQDSGRA